MSQGPSPSPASQSAPVLRSGPGLSAEALQFAWPGRPVLLGVSLRLAPGSVTALQGANGAGKTTLIRLLTGVLQPDAGEIRLGTVRIASERRRYLQRIGCAQAADRGLYARLDARANLSFGLALALVGPARRRQLLAAAIERFGLAPLERTRVDRMSTGQRQRVRLALAFAHDPDVVLLDEPTASLDPDAIALLADAVTAARQRGAGVLWMAPLGAPPPLPADAWLELRDGRLECR